MTKNFLSYKVLHQTTLLGYKAFIKKKVRY